MSATALMAAVSGRAEVARTGATVKQKNDRVQRFLQRLYGFTEYLQLGGPGGMGRAHHVVRLPTLGRGELIQHPTGQGVNDFLTIRGWSHSTHRASASSDRVLGLKQDIIF